MNVREAFFLTIINHQLISKSNKMKRPCILISNDDGYHAKGINKLIEFLSDIADLIVVSPESHRSGYACAFSVEKPLRMKLRREKEGMQMWSCTGTPVDCVKVGLNEFFTDTKPDMIIGGINHGDNASVNTHYSGTMGVTMEGCMKYIPSVAFSLCDHNSDADFDPMRPIVREIVERVLREGLPKGVCLNVNVPVVEKVKGVKVCRMAYGSWKKEIIKRAHPHGYEYYWLTGSYSNDEPEASDTDNYWLTKGYATITPTTMDVTAYEMVNRMKPWEKEF